METLIEAPLISICLPSLNTFPFLQERMDTILGQTYTNWELIVIDSFSDDGSWEFFQELAKKDQRISIAQAPRGLYKCWNECVQRAKGKYVYIATSDDTMALDCLEKLVAALEEYDECDLAHCALKLIDQHGAPVTDQTWPDVTVFAHGAAKLINKRHVRRAPYDGLLHLTGVMVYLSISQLLIRRSLFARIGGFDTRWGPMGDRNWEMKAGLVANTVHVPETWATWRIYPTHASAAITCHSPEYCRNIEEMIADAVVKCESYLAPQVVPGLREHWLRWSGEMRNYYSKLAVPQSALRKRLFQTSQAFHGQKSVRSEVMSRLRGRPRWTDRAPGELRSWLESLGLGPILADVSEPASPNSCCPPVPKGALKSEPNPAPKLSGI
jgi:glycosyltransferase involved in cell wall biosynthesis